MRCKWTIFLLWIWVEASATLLGAQSGQLEMTPVSSDAYETMVQFFEYDRKIPLDDRIVEKWETEDFIRYKVVFRGAGDQLAPAYLAIPKKGYPSYPCVLQLHGLGDSREMWWGDKRRSLGGHFTNQMLAAGFAVFSMDARYHGERNVHNNYESPALMVFRDGFVNRYREMVIQSTIDYRRGMDYLESRTDIDKNRIGVIGYSMGGVMSFILAAVDSRIRVVVDCVSPPMTATSYAQTAIPLSERSKAASVTPFNFAQAITSQPFLMLMGRKDLFYTVEESNQLYHLIGSPVKEIVFYDCGHQLPPESISRAIEWFYTYLGNHPN